MKAFSTLLTILWASTLHAQVIFQVEPSESEVLWHAEKVTGTHDGTIQIKSGVLHMKDDKFSGGAFLMDMTSIKVTDMDDEEYNQKLARHLMSPDFFSAAKFPLSEFKISKVIHQGKDRYKVEGDLTIKGITKKNKFTAEVIIEGDLIKATADLVIDRAEFDVRYGSGSFFDDLGDKTIYDEFQLKISLVANKKELLHFNHRKGFLVI